jgi:hypothetical protein
MVKIVNNPERNRCLKVVLEEFEYWREAMDSEVIGEMAMGAVGACSNIVSRIIDPKRPKTGTEIKNGGGK